MDRIWEPSRIKLMPVVKPEGGLLCEKPRGANDRAALVLYRGDSNFVILSKYPYNPGHLIVSSCRRSSDLEELADDEARNGW